MSTADVPLQASIPLRRLEVPASDRRQSSAFADSSFDRLGGILLRGYGLTIVTLGIYRFWMKTNIRRWYWSNTVIGGDALEYRGTGRELFIGFLIAVGMLVPIYAIIVGGTYLSGLLSWQTSTRLFFIVFLAAAQYASYRARRYRLTRTAWRGLTFSQGGNGWHYAGLWLAGAVATIASLGFAFPWVRAQLEGYKIRNTRFGTAQGAFAPALGALLAWWALLWGPALGTLVVAAVPIYSAGNLRFVIEATGLFLGFGDAGTSQFPVAAGTGFAFLSAGLGLGGLWAILFWPVYKTIEFRTFTAGTRLGPVAFDADIGAGWYYFAVVRFFVSYLVVSVVIAGLVLLALLAVGNGLGMQSFVSDVGTIIGASGYVAILISFVILRELILVQGFWRYALSHLTVTGLDQTGDIIASGQSDRAVGEGLADAFELGGF